MRQVPEGTRLDEELEDELKDSGRYRSWDVSVEDVFIGTDESDCEVRATR